MDLDRSLLARLDGLRLAAPGRVVGQRQGERRSKQVGAGLEFADYRQYQPGDDMRRVDWNVYARLGTLQIRVQEESRNLRIRLVLDASGSMGTDAKLDQAGALVAGLAWIGLRGRDTVVAEVCGGETAGSSFQGHGPGAAGGLFELLSGVVAGGEADLVSALKRGRARADRVVLASDMLVEDDVRDATLAAMAGAGRHPVLLHILGEDEREPPGGGDRILEDAETGQSIAWSSAAAAAYAAEFARWRGALEQACARWRVRYIYAPTGSPPASYFSGPLRRSGVVRGRGGAT